VLPGVAVALVVGFHGAPDARAETVVDAGEIRAEIAADPWRLEIVDRQGRSVLAEHPDTGGAPTGTLGFRVSGAWRHATRVIESSSDAGVWNASLATTDPARTIELRLAPADEGSIALDARVIGPRAGLEAVGIGFAAPEAERYLGFGERSNAAEQSGNVIENYVADGPYQDAEYPAINLFTPVWGLRDGRPEATYFPVPWLLSTAGYGVLVENPETSLFRLRSERADAWSVEVVAAPEGEPGAATAPPPDRLQLRFFGGPDPADALRRFTAATGRQPEPVAPWALGTWFQADDDEAAELAALRESDAPVSVLQTYLHYLPCGDQVGVEDEQPGRTAGAHDAGVAITTYFNPMICSNYQPAYGEAAAAGALTETATGEPYVYRYGADVDQAFLVGQFDFFSEAGAERYATLLAEAIDDGYDGWMEDFGEYTPLDSVSAGSIDGTRAHNPYATRYHCAAYEATRDAGRPIVRFQRSGWTGAAACADVVWGGDPTTAWGFDGLRSAVTQAISAGSSGIGIWGSDIGGFFALGDNRLTPELLTRWVQLGAVSPVMRTQANGVAVPSKARPQVLDPDQIDNWRRYTKLHTQLYPYLAGAVRAYRETGLPPVRHLALAYPRDPVAAEIEDQFLFGPDLLAAPVLEPGATERSLYLPRGRWVDLWRSAAYRERSGAISIRRARPTRGGRQVTVPAPLEELPLMVRAGAVLALLPPTVDTLADYGSGDPEIDTLAENRRRLRLLAFPRGRSRSTFNAGERLRSRESAAGWRLSIRGKLRREYRLQASLRTLRNPFVPCSVEVGGRALAPRRWNFNRATGVLNVRLRGRSIQLLATRRGCD